MTDRWYALCVCGGRELSIAEDLRDDGHTVLMPTQTIIHRSRVSRRQTTERKIIRPLVPSYVFCSVPFVKHDKVWDVIRVDGAPYPIPHAQFARLIALHESEAKDGEPARQIAIGDLVKTLGTAWDGHEMTVTGYNDAEGTYALSTRLLGHDVDVHIKQDAIRPRDVAA